MTDTGNAKVSDQARRLSDAIRDVKNAAADRDDVVVDLREAHRMRLELLAAELEPVFAEVPNDVDMFDFAVSSGLQPRLWIDAVSHVAMGRDRRTYRFLKDTRVGRVVLAESTEIKPVADQVTRYVAERIVERQRLMEGIAEPAASPVKAGLAEAEPPLVQDNAEPRSKAAKVRSAIGLVLAGAAVGLVASAVVLWDRIAELWKF